MPNRKRIQELRKSARILQRQIDDLHDEISALELKQTQYDHPCTCVRLNKEIGIHDMIMQDTAGRRGLTGGGWVSDTLSAVKSCVRCNGTGKIIGG